MDLEAIMLSERQMLYDISHMWNLKYNNNKCIQQSRRRHKDIENKLSVTREERKGRRVKLGLGD